MKKPPTVGRALLPLIIIPIIAVIDIALIVAGVAIDNAMYNPPPDRPGFPFPAITIIFIPPLQFKIGFVKIRPAPRRSVRLALEGVVFEAAAARIKIPDACPDTKDALPVRGNPAVGTQGA